MLIVLTNILVTTFIFIIRFVYSIVVIKVSYSISHQLNNKYNKKLIFHSYCRFADELVRQRSGHNYARVGCNLITGEMTNLHKFSSISVAGYAHTHTQKLALRQVEARRNYLDDWRDGE